MIRPVEKVRWGVSYPGPRDVWGPRRRPEILSTPECTIFEKKNSKKISQRGPVKMFVGPTRMFLRAPLWLSTGLFMIANDNSILKFLTGI